MRGRRQPGISEELMTLLLEQGRAEGRAEAAREIIGSMRATHPLLRAVFPPLLAPAVTLATSAQLRAHIFAACRIGGLDPSEIPPGPGTRDDG